MFEDTLRLIVDLPNRLPAPSQPGRLDALFAALAAEPPAHPPDEIEDLIWATWSHPPEREAAIALDRAVAAMAGRMYDVAETRLGEIVARYPALSEGWNKRATLLYLLNRDAESVRDIERTLALEPRHFGAVSGFAEICLRQGDPANALIAYEAALRIHPHLHGARRMAEELRLQVRRSLH